MAGTPTRTWPKPTAAQMKTQLEQAKALTDEHLDKVVPASSATPQTLHRAMRYSLFGGGKRLRPALVLAAAHAAGGRPGEALPAACAVELVHTYSLIHDDLPAMDDDDLRRGRPTCHRVFGQAMAVLAGDGMLTLAFELLTQSPKTQAVPELVRSLAQGAGCQGMVGGQVLDIEGEGSKPTLDRVQAIHNWKTAALIATSCELGGLAAGASLKECKVLWEVGRKIGLAFQICDDILDETSTPEQLGKTPGKDKKAGKTTYPAVLGRDAAQAEAVKLVEVAVAELDPWGEAAQDLRGLAWLAIERQS